MTRYVKHRLFQDFKNYIYFFGSHFFTLQTVGQDGLEEDTKGFGFGFGNWRLKRKVRKLIRAVDILEERLSTNEVSICNG